ncbi:MAG: histidine decarboxylase [Phycisphaerales bacterium]
MAMHRRQFLGGAAAAIVATSCYPARLHAQAQHIAWRAADALPELRAMRDLPRRRTSMLGYPVNMNLHDEAFHTWREQLAHVGVDRFAFNNVGDPFQHGHFPFNTHALEREAILRCARDYAFDHDDAWGFLSNSGTDSNMHGMYMGRTILRGRTHRPVRAYFTREAHYSVHILADLLGVEWIPVRTHPGGAMDERDLAHKLGEHPGEPALIVATIGTTFKGAVDDIDAINRAREGHQSYLHLDAALFGGYLPYTEHAQVLHQRRDGNDRYDSIAVSCHKFFGFPSPAGIYVTTRRVFDEFHRRFSDVHDPEYILQVPGTITCSRDAAKAGEFLYFTTDHAHETERRDARQILDDTAYLLDQLRARHPDLKPQRASPLSNTVYFRSPPDSIVHDYVLATATVERGNGPAPHAHVVVMPHATREVLDRFLEDLEVAR